MAALQSKGAVIFCQWDILNRFEAAPANTLWVEHATSGGATGVATYGTLYTSPDGVNWTSRVGLGFSLVAGVVAGAGGFLVYGNYTSQLLYSDDAINWADVSTGTAYNTRSMIWIDDLARFVLGIYAGDTHISNPAYKPSLNQLSCDPA